MSHQILYRRVNLENGVTMIPCKLLNPVFVHLILNLDLLFIRYLTVLKPNRLILYARLRIINFGDDQILDIFPLIGDASKQPYDFMLAEIRVDIH